MLAVDADPATAARLLLAASPERMAAAAEAMTLAGHGPLVTYSRKVFIPLTRLCRDVCHYCTFATTPRLAGHAYLTRDEVLAIAHAGVAAGCREALFTLGERPEDRHPAARTALDAMGYASTLDYLRDMARAVLDETGLLPHLNPGLMDDAALAMLRPVSASMGFMLETNAERLSQRGGPHFGSPDKLPARRLAAIAAAGRARVPFTTGLLIGIGETRAERIEALIAIRDLHRAYGHIQEVIIQNFRAKSDTLMADHPEPSLAEHAWTISAARLILGPAMTIQAPPNLHAPDELAALLRAGVNDWGGVSPVTPDHVNPEAPWPHLDALEAGTAATGRILRQRLAIGRPSRAIRTCGSIRRSRRRCGAPSMRAGCRCWTAGTPARTWRCRRRLPAGRAPPAARSRRYSTRRARAIGWTRRRSCACSPPTGRICAAWWRRRMPCAARWPATR